MNRPDTDWSSKNFSIGFAQSEHLYFVPRSHFHLARHNYAAFSNAKNSPSFAETDTRVTSSPYRLAQKVVERFLAYSSLVGSWRRRRRPAHDRHHRCFETWPGDVEAQIGRISRELYDSGRELDIGEIAWLAHRIIRCDQRS